MKSEVFQKLLDKTSFPKELSSTLINLVKDVNSPELEQTLFCFGRCEIICKSVFFPDGFYPYTFFEKARGLFDSKGILHTQGFAGLYLLYLEKTYDLSKKLGLCEDIFTDTASAVMLEIKQGLCNKTPYFDYVFFANYLVLNIIRLGDIDFQNGIFDFDKDVHFDGHTVKNGQRAVYMHIPKGADISQTSRQHSYELCKMVFGNCLLICDSWLLFSEHKNMLREHSNILSLMDDFHIIAEYKTTDYSELFHVFGKNADFSDTSSLPSKTCLQKEYIKRIQKALPIGSALGIRKV